MTAETFFLLALVFYAVGVALILAGLRVEALRSPGVLLLATGLGVAAQTAGIGVHCTQSASHFFTSSQETYWLLSWALGLGYLAVLAAWKMRPLGALLLPINVVLLTMAHFSPGAGAAPASEAANSQLLPVHILSAFLGYGLFLTAFAASAVYLQEQRLLKRKLFGVLLRGLPSLEKLDRAANRCSWAGLLLFTVALVTGAIMANAVDKPQWFLQPKILATEATWLLFLVLAIGHATGRLVGRSAARFVLAGAALVMLTFVIAHPFREPALPAAVEGKAAL